MTNGQPELPPYKVAFIIDGEVVDIIHTQSRLAAILLSEPTIVDISDTTVDGNQIFPGFKYDSETNTFSAPNVEG